MRDNILKDVYANDKIELSSIDVKLGIIDELKASQVEVSTRLQSSLKSVVVFESKFKDFKDQLNKESQYMYKIFAESIKKWDIAKNKAKELGIELPKEWNAAVESIRKDVAKMPFTNLQNIFPK